MPFFKDLQLKWKLALSFIFIVSFFTASGSLIFFQIRSADIVEHNAVTKIQIAHDIQINSANYFFTISTIPYIDNSIEVSEAQTYLAEHSYTMISALHDLHDIPNVSSYESRIIEENFTKALEYEGRILHVYDILHSSASLPEATLDLARTQQTLYLQEMGLLNEEVSNAVDSLVKNSSEMLDITQTRTQRIFNLSIIIFILGLIGSLLVGFSFSHFTILKPIRILSDAIKKITKGDLDTHISVDSEDEIGQFSVLLNNMTSELAEFQNEMDQKVENKTKELFESRKKFETLTQTSPDCIKMFDLNGKLTYMSPSGILEHSLKNAEDAIGWDYMSSIIKEYRPVLKQAMQSALNGKTTTFEVKHDKTGGTIRDWCLMSLVPIRSDDGNVTAVFGVSRDISKSKINKEKIERLASIVETSFEGVGMVNLDQKYTYVNKSWQDMTGWTAEEVVGIKTPSILKTEHQSSEFYKRMWLTLNQGQVFNSEFINKKKDGSEFTVEQGIMPLKSSDGIITGYVGFQRDITEEKRARSEIKQLDNLKSQFITALTHVTRTPLNEIRWSLESLLSGEFNHLTDQQKTFIRRALQSEATVLRLIQNMNLALDIERKTLVINTSPTSILSLVKSVAQTFDEGFILKGVKKEVKEPRVELPNLDIDVEKIRIAISVLIDNALKYTREGGLVKISFAKTKLGVKISVEDSGIGIPVSEQTHVFDRFFRASNASIEHTDGVGLGLFIAKSIVEVHGGNVSFKSTEGKGECIQY
ncbi:MAG: PAS domain S-box protein [Candidatus Uhrbacteria bacterium]|nr:PAS domain S-box protein [Candidatus Uhrbacteria bacterium]